jgi:hypothetical protein
VVLWEELLKHMAATGPTFYEQVLGVNIRLRFLLWFSLLMMFATHVALHRVSIRTVCELRW